MGRETILKSKAKIEAAPLDNYCYPNTDGSFTGTLSYRKWHPRKACLLCYFDTDDGEKLILPAWWQSWGISYSPKWTHLSFADDVIEESRWYCEYQKTSGGFTSWKTAYPDDEVKSTVRVSAKDFFAKMRRVREEKLSRGTESL